MANLWRVLHTFVEYPGFVLMRSVARFDSVRYVVVRTQRVVRGPADRFITGLRQRRSNYFADVDPAALASAVERDGLALGLSLPADVVGELVEFARDNRCWADRDPRLGFFPAQIEQARAKVGRRFLLAYYFNVRRYSRLIAGLAEDPVLLEVAARYLGTIPRLVGTNMWWSYPEQADSATRENAAQLFHYDLDDFRFIKFFFYLTDVDATAGPHVVVRGTHRNKRVMRLRDRFKVRRYSDEEVLAIYGIERIVPITGPAGTGFVEDTLCIHKGEAPTGRSRLVLQLQYALNDFGNQHDDIDERELAMIV